MVSAEAPRIDENGYAKALRCADATDARAEGRAFALRSASSDAVTALPATSPPPSGTTCSAASPPSAPPSAPAPASSPPRLLRAGSQGWHFVSLGENEQRMSGPRGSGVTVSLKGSTKRLEDVTRRPRAYEREGSGAWDRVPGRDSPLVVLEARHDGLEHALDLRLRRARQRGTGTK